MVGLLTTQTHIKLPPLRPPQPRQAIKQQHCCRSLAMTPSETMLKLRLALVDIEHLGEQFLSTRAKVTQVHSMPPLAFLTVRVYVQMIDLDKQRNDVRQALTACRKVNGCSSSKVVLDVGCGVQARLPRDRAVAYLAEDQARLEGEMEAARKELKRLTGLLAEKGATPEDVGPGMLQALLSLTDKRAKERAQD